MTSAQHPSHYLNANITELLRNAAAEAESKKQLHFSQLQLIQQEGWLKMFVPKDHGGRGLSLPEIIRMEEGLAWADGSTAWVVTLCAGAAWFVGFLDATLAREVFADPNVCFAGSGMTTGTAEILPEGYKLNGFWKYASGALHAQVFTANFLIQKNGEQLVNEDGSPLIRSFILKSEEVALHKTWATVGMVATGSHSFEVKDIVVPTLRSFKIDAAKAVIDAPVFRYPFLQLAEATLTVNLSGMAIRFIELCEEMVSQRTNRQSLEAIKKLQRAKVRMEACRNLFYQTTEASWKSCVSRKPIPIAQLKQVSRASHALAKLSRQLVDDLYPLGGLTAADPSQEINRVWRNLHTASQHSLFAFR